MKREIYLISLLLSLLLVACGSTDNYGYPSHITFEKDGGTKVCSGTSGCYQVEIHDYNGDGNTTYSKGENDTIIATYDWLTVKFRLYTEVLKITALPNTTGKKRTLYLSGMVNDFSADIKVTQH
ncbi:hypothetical protein PRBRB14_16690 [Hallella multisaccharivorax DSM 17128]|uniref:Lipoprotein n=1 Tax=Hallella multisaccharivorax DSM 17128 TaxID=688246 RepID=F8NB21_9BACT|nr:BACON domain-containing protein [Hallella multisaccharivorax]EGN57929.1 hypothetical protein Premu_2575 [Hallella multisaccharivorax DSM 17128]GJG30790.1 hypothetical protein PRBRB14_16690 [Hallella multisaccharivorax DSM 17128]